MQDFVSSAPLWLKCQNGKVDILCTIKFVKETKPTQLFTIVYTFNLQIEQCRVKSYSTSGSFYEAGVLLRRTVLKPLVNIV